MTMYSSNRWVYPLLAPTGALVAIMHQYTAGNFEIFMQPSPQGHKSCSQSQKHDDTLGYEALCVVLPFSHCRKHRSLSLFQRVPSHKMAKIPDDLVDLSPGGTTVFDKDKTLTFGSVSNHLEFSTRCPQVLCIFIGASINVWPINPMCNLVQLLPESTLWMLNVARRQYYLVWRPHFKLGEERLRAKFMQVFFPLDYHTCIIWQQVWECGLYM